MTIHDSENINSFEGPPQPDGMSNKDSGNDLPNDLSVLNSKTGH